MVEDLSDEALVERAQHGNREAFLALYNRYFTKVFNRVKSKIPYRDVEDVTQDIFVALVRSLDSFEHRSRFNTWLYTMVNRQIADYYRYYSRKGRDQPRVSLEGREDLASADFDTGHIADKLLIQRALNAVPPHYQEIILMRFADGLTFAEIAEANDQSLEAAKSLYRRAIQAVRDQIDGS